MPFIRSLCRGLRRGMVARAQYSVDLSNVVIDIAQWRPTFQPAGQCLPADEQAPLHRIAVLVVATHKVFVGKRSTCGLVETVGRGEVVHIGFTRIVDDLDRARVGEHARDHAIVDVGEVPPSVPLEGRCAREQRVYEDRMDFNAALYRPEYLARMLAEILILDGDDLRPEVVMCMSARERCQILGRDANRTVLPESCVECRQKGFGLGDDIASPTTLEAIAPV